MNKSQKILILGHSGFIGSRLEQTLRDSGYTNVLGRSLPGVDLTDLNSAKTLAEHFTSDACLVLAAAVKRQFGDTLESFRQNTAIVENICKLLETNPVKRIIYFSSAAVYGEETHNTDIHEETQVNPTSFYGINKYTSERLLIKTIAATKAGSIVCLRPPLIYGPGDKGKTYGPAGFSTAAKAADEITLWGDGTELREFIFIDDACRVVEKLIDSDFTGPLNLVSGTRYCFADVISILRDFFPALRVSYRERSKQKADNAFSHKKIKALLPADFTFTPLREGIDRILKS